ncbi:AraC family transcriptional regulator of adaptative response / DNA-3-methyladenine glycosylase II [Saccharothrix tamanrassetensis]|uniref:AraC family transcriptional regulator of adaptative response / DNA-3-methyladenine glycosylase II n=1 Tax=Saccharothrix tamanrassetensis TaxID=1051531 RepID=A0A841CH93_9PSEU|nr:AlkA N-terminal domain-containing protein [Saccharothrix tamanrassetensis]MBB5957912.1 AraC family transcriptional regulator of adaptative response / DNA-3-methyladenine glycosylase II [Saccharothrix tamanrassetensis]
MTTYSAVRTTGIYCRPGCGAKPLAENVRTFALPAAAEAAGFRACLRCRPYRVAGPIAVDAPEMVCRAVQLVIAGALDTGTEAGLAARLGLSSRHLRRLFHDHLGTTPDRFARSRRAHFARRLLDDSDLTVAEVAFASGFGSLRQFNRTMTEVFRAAPSELRERRRRADRLAADGGLTVRLPFQAPYDWDAMAAFLGARAVPGVESVRDSVYRRTISLDGDAGVLEVRPGGDDHLLLRAHLPYWEGVIHVVERAGRMVGVDLDVAPAVERFRADPVLGPLVAARPGVRVPGAWGPFEMAVGVVAGDAVGGLVRRYGQPVPGLGFGLTHLFPAAEVLATGDVPEVVRELAARVVAGEVLLDGGDDLSVVPGISADMAARIGLRSGDRDAFPAEDPLLRRALEALGPAEGDWQPWRSLAAAHLIASGRGPVGRRAGGRSAGR